MNIGQLLHSFADRLQELETETRTDVKTAALSRLQYEIRAHADDADQEPLSYLPDAAIFVLPASSCAVN